MDVEGGWPVTRKQKEGALGVNRKKEKGILEEKGSYQNYCKTKYEEEKEERERERKRERDRDRDRDEEMDGDRGRCALRDPPSTPFVESIHATASHVSTDSWRECFASSDKGRACSSAFRSMMNLSEQVRG